MRTWGLLAVLLAIGCASCSSGSTGSPVALKPASEVEASRMDPLEFGKPTKIGKLTVTVDVPTAVADTSHYYGARSWTVHLRVENAGSSDVQVPQFQIRCEDGATGEDWIGATISANDSVPARSFLEGDSDLSVPIDKFDDPPVLHKCVGPRLLVGDHLSSVLG